MKTNTASSARFCVLIGGLIQFLGCTSESTNVPPVTTVTPTNVPPAQTTATNAVVKTEMALQTVAPVRPALPPGVDEVIDMAQARVGDGVLVEYVKTSTNRFDISSEDILYLKDLGVTEVVIAEMLRHSSEVHEPTAAPPLPAPAPAPEPASALAGAAAMPLAPAGPPAAPAVEAAPPPPPEAPAQTPQVTYNYFYGSLAPYGDWVELPGYGWCWRPTVCAIDPDWRPYCHNGRWLWTDSGWYWHSDYSWGWAPFHYGRWHRHARHGWVWMPGHVWGPAWVTWRRSDMHCGWAPLPPEAYWDASVGLTWYGSPVAVGFGFGLGADCFAFLSYHHFCDPWPWRHCVPRHQIVQVYNNTTIININVHRGSGHGRILNEGIPPTRITEVTRREVPKVGLRDVREGPSVRPSPVRRGQERAELPVFRPTPPPDLRVDKRENPTPRVAASRRAQETVSPGASMSRPVRVERPARFGTTALAPEQPLEARTPSLPQAGARDSRGERGLTTTTAPASPPRTSSFRGALERLPNAKPATPEPRAGTPTSSPDSRPATVERSTPAFSRLVAESPGTPTAAAPTQPRVERPAAQTPAAPRPLQPSLLSTQPTRSSPRQPSVSLPAPENRALAPSHAPARPSAPARSAPVELPSRSAAPPPSRVETRKLEPATPAWTPPPKFASPPPRPGVSMPPPSAPRAAAPPSLGPPPSAGSRFVPPPAPSAPPRSMPSMSAPRAPSPPPASSGSGLSAPRATGGVPGADRKRN